MSRQAEAERQRRARVISAEGELQASESLAKAAAVAAEKNSTLVLPFPVELLHFLDRAARPDDSPSTTAEMT